MRRVGAFAAAVLTAYALAAIMYTQLNLGSLREMGVEITSAERFSATLHDLFGMDVLLLLLVVGFAIAFAVAHLIVRRVPRVRSLGYPLAGFAAVYVIDYAIFQTMGNIHLFPVTRTAAGTLAMCMAGAAGGYVFARLLPFGSKQ